MEETASHFFAKTQPSLNFCLKRLSALINASFFPVLRDASTFELRRQAARSPRVILKQQSKLHTTGQVKSPKV